MAQCGQLMRTNGLTAPGCVRKELATRELGEWDWSMGMLVVVA